MTNGVPIPLERYVLEKMAEAAARGDLKRDALEAKLELKMEASKEALDLQAKEYERRLTDLNHAHDLALKDKGTFATKELVEREIRLLAERTGKLEIARANREGTDRAVWAFWGFLGAMVVSVAGFVVSKAWG